MKKYTYAPQEYNLITNSVLPFAVYQFINKRVVTIAISKGFCTQFGFSSIEEACEVMDTDMYRDAHPDDVSRIADAAVQFAFEKQPYDVVYRSKIEGVYHIIHAKGQHIYRDDIRLALVWYLDEGEYREDAVGHTNNEALSLSYSTWMHGDSLYRKEQYDYLTGLPSMSYFFELANVGKEALLERGKVPVMLFFDLTGMKYFNAKYGFAEGNNLIRAFSRILTKRFSNENCCRFGMDRFCVYTDETNLETRLWELFSDCENMNNGRTLPVRAGIYSYAVEKVAPSFACDRAKMACDTNHGAYVSHFTYFDNSMLRQAEIRQYIIDNIDRALQEEWVQVYYQPIVRAATGRVCDEEALARWIDPERGLFHPEEFIPILEDANLIYKLDLYVTEKILDKMKTQADKGLYVVPISVNLSRSDFDTCDIVSEIQQRIDKAGISREKLTIEITESVIGGDYEYMKSQIHRFRSLGFKVWMDDFGSGYSSLDVLQDIHFNLMKIDMKFMQQFYKSEKSKIILTELIKMAAGLNIETIVEGVETQEQVEFLKEVGCTKLQGFYYCKPIPLQQILNRYETGTQIGFENPEESEYFAALGRINLYDLSAVTSSDNEELFGSYFNTLPMTILELNASDLRIVRSNKSYRLFLHKYFEKIKSERKLIADRDTVNNPAIFFKKVSQCKNSPSAEIFDETLSDGTIFHIYLRRIAVNPVTKVTAFVVVVLGVIEKPSQD
ncbi:MAG: EAL domain-containing protein [Treponema sp.]|nr:EAL domain-containing protein [Treponema sp.]